MATHAHRRNGVPATLKESREAERSQLHQREVGRAANTARDRPRPLDFDPLGFPLPQPMPSFVRRVTRLLRDG